MFIADAYDTQEFAATFVAAELAIKARRELAHGRDLRGYYAQGRVGLNSK